MLSFQDKEIFLSTLVFLNGIPLTDSYNRGTAVILFLLELTPPQQTASSCKIHLALFVCTYSNCSICFVTVLPTFKINWKNHREWWPEHCRSLLPARRRHSNTAPAAAYMSTQTGAVAPVHVSCSAATQYWNHCKD